MGRPELRIPPYIATRPPVHPCRDFRKIFSRKIPVKFPKIPETSRKDGAKIFPKKFQKIASDMPKRAESAKRSKCNTAQNFSQNFFQNFFENFPQNFFCKIPEIQHCKEFCKKFFTKFLGATQPGHPHYFLTKDRPRSPETPVCDDEDDPYLQMRSHFLYCQLRYK